MKNAQPLIVVLIFSAVVLAALLVLVPAPQSARAENATMLDYTLISAAPDVNSDQMATVIDNHDGKLITYQLNGSRLDVVGTCDIERAFR